MSRSLLINLVHKTISSLQSVGISETFARIIAYLQGTISRMRFERNVLSLEEIEDRFTAIYEKNYWGSEESVSGGGSTLEYTENLRNKLPELFERYSIKSVFDAPCGDFNWMRWVIADGRVRYVGGDIVRHLVDSNTARFTNDRIRFIQIDLTREAFPPSDLMICRDCLFHLSYHDTRLVLQNFAASNISYFLTTTHLNPTSFKNKDIATGDFRLVDLFSAPYFLPRDVPFRIDDWKTPAPPREMCLWSRDQVASALRAFQ